MRIGLDEGVSLSGVGGSAASGAAAFQIQKYFLYSRDILKLLRRNLCAAPHKSNISGA